MKILFYSPVKLLSGGGCERWHCDVTASLKKQFGHDIQIITGNLGKSQWTEKYLQEQLEVPYELIKFPILFGALIPTPQIFFKMLGYFRKAESIHIIQGFIGQDIFILLLKLFSGKRIIVGHHAPTFHKVMLHNIYMKYVSRFLFNFFDSHMTLNSSDKRFLEEKWKIKNVHFIPSGIRIERFIKLKRQKHPKLNFITVGIYRAQKGLDLLVEAISLFNQTVNNNQAIFRIVGGGEQKQIITDYAKKNNNILDMGYIKYEDVPELYKQSDVYLLSSREEPFGLVLIEGWSSGIPALATKTEGPLDMVTENKNGWFIEETTPQGILKGITKVYSKWIKSSNFLKDMEKSCRETGEMFSIDVTAKRMDKLFRGNN